MAGGRPRIEIDIEELIRMINIQCTQEEIAYVLGISVDTITLRVKQLYGVSFTEFYKTHNALGKVSIRRAQFKLMETNAAMAIWLGKQYLGQREPSVEIPPLEEESDDEMKAYEE
jgi:hypothetical protein